MALDRIWTVYPDGYRTGADDAILAREAWISVEDQSELASVGESTPTGYFPIETVTVRMRHVTDVGLQSVLRDDLGAFWYVNETRAVGRRWLDVGVSRYGLRVLSALLPFAREFPAGKVAPPGWGVANAQGVPVRTVAVGDARQDADSNGVGLGYQRFNLRFLPGDKSETLTPPNVFTGAGYSYEGNPNLKFTPFLVTCELRRSAAAEPIPGLLAVNRSDFTGDGLAWLFSPDAAAPFTTVLPTAGARGWTLPAGRGATNDIAEGDILVVPGVDG